MKKIILERLLLKCRIMAETQPAACRRILQDMASAPERLLLPAMRAEFDLTRIRFVGPTVEGDLRKALDELQDYLERLEAYPAETNGDPNYLEFDKDIFHFPELDPWLDERVQKLFEKMLNEIPDTRTRNILSEIGLFGYRDTENLYRFPAHINRLPGAGTNSVRFIKQFLDDFRKAYYMMTSNNGERAFKLYDISVEYPFLNEDEVEFVYNFMNDEGRYPVFFLARRFIQASQQRGVRAYARYNGIIGRFESLSDIAKDLSVTFERVRQLSKIDVDKLNSMAWDAGRWAALPGFDRNFMTAASLDWKRVSEAEHVEDMSFYAALSLISLMRPIVIVSLNRDGRRANSRRNAVAEWEEPFILFAHDAAITDVNFVDMIRTLAHDVSLTRTRDLHFSMSKLIGEWTKKPLPPELQAQVQDLMTEVLPVLPDVGVDGDDIFIRANHINYVDDIYDILQQRDEAMTIDEIYDVFRKMHPDDHHTNSTFLRSYMLADDRFEAVGRKSTYQLREWKRFSGGLMEMAVNIVTENGGPMLTEELCQRMYEQRPSTTVKSCMSTVYLAVQKGVLRYLITDEHPSVSSYVGLVSEDLPDGFWLSPIDKAGAIESLRRFVSEYQRWPFDMHEDGVEAQLYYVLNKYTRKSDKPQAEVQRFIESITDKNPYELPHTRRDLAFLNNCRKLKDYVMRHHAMPRYDETPALGIWYRNVTRQKNATEPFRQYHLQHLDSVLKRYLDEQTVLNFDID